MDQSVPKRVEIKTSYVLCQSCKGTGFKSPESSPYEFPVMGTWPCPECNATGKVKMIDAIKSVNTKAL